MKFNALVLALSLLALSFKASAAIQVNVSPATLVTYEDGVDVTYQVVLDQAPSAGETVTVTPSVSDLTEGSVSGVVSFTSADWDTPQLITLTPGASGDGNDGNVSYTIANITTAAGGTASFNGAPALSVNVTNRNIEGINSLIMEPASGAAFILDEGSSQTVLISANGAPTNDVAIDFSIAGGEAILSTGTVVLNAGNGYTATVNVTAVADGVVDADQPFTVVTAASYSLDGSFSGINLNDIEGTAVNTDMAAPAAPAEPIPTLGTLSQLALASLLLLGGLLGMRRFS